MAKSKTELSKLRDIGWACWDPIGLKSILGDTGIGPVIDEYDEYLWHVASLLAAGKSDAEAIEYLMEIEFSHMALGRKSFASASLTVASIRSYLESL